MTVQIRSGWVRVYTVDPPLSVLARLGQDRPDVSQGYGGWQEVERPRRSPITTFKAPPGLHLTLPLLLDGWATGTVVEADISRLERMGLASGANGEPPKVKLQGRGQALPYQARTWVLDTITWGDALMNKNGDRVRQQATLSLLEYVEDVHLQERSPANRRRSKAKAAHKKPGAAHKRIQAGRSSKQKAGSATRSTVVSPDFGAGESLSDIAARELGDASRWPEIAKLNGLRDPANVSPGQVLRLP
jgi:hypothetical protein